MKNDQEIRQSIRAAIDDCTRGIDEAPSLQFRIARKARGEKPVKKRMTFRIICIAAALLLGTMTALAAGVDDVNAVLYELWPEAARALRPLNLSDEQAGIRLEVLSATLSEDHYLVVFSLTDPEGGRINEQTECAPRLEFPIAETYGRVELISYDPVKHQAVYGANFDYSVMPGHTVPRGAEPIRLSVAGMERDEKTSAELWQLMAGRDYTAEAVPVPSEYARTETFRLGDEPEEEAAVPDVLNPANNLHIPVTDGIELSGIGWIGGNLHIQLHAPGNMARLETETAEYSFVRHYADVSLCDLQGREMMYEEDFYGQRIRDTGEPFAWKVEWWDGDDYWMEVIFPVREDEMENYALNAECIYMRSGVEDLLGYEWAVTFPANMIRTEE